MQGMYAGELLYRLEVGEVHDHNKAQWLLV